MLKKRLIPIVQLMGNSVVKTVSFSNPRQVGDATATVKVFSARAADELIIIDVGASKEARVPDFNFISLAAKSCFMPLTVGGGIKTYEDAAKAFDAGADKILIGTILHQAPKEVEKIALNYGSQALVASIDCRSIGNSFKTFSMSAKQQSLGLSEMIHRANEVGVGELTITDIDREGRMNGYSIHLLEMVLSETKLPIIINGGAGCVEDFEQAFSCGAHAVAASSVFFWKGLTNSEIKSSLRNKGFFVTA